MSKKKKCKNCSKSMNWALPVRVTEQNIDYARHCLRIAELTIVCGMTMKTKRLDHEQYCKHFQEKSEMEKKHDRIRMDDISKLRRMIEEYDSRNMQLKTDWNEITPDIDYRRELGFRRFAED